MHLTKLAVIAPSQVREAANQSCIHVLHIQDKQHQHANTQALPEASTQGKLNFHDIYKIVMYVCIC